MKLNGKKCPECGGRRIEREDDGRNFVLLCQDCGFVIDDELKVSGSSLLV